MKPRQFACVALMMAVASVTAQPVALPMQSTMRLAADRKATPEAPPREAAWRQWTREPVADRLNKGLDALFDGFSLMFRRPPEGSMAWWERPLADRLNARIDAFQAAVGRIERRDVVRAATQLGLNGPEIWPEPILTPRRLVGDASQRLDLLSAWQYSRDNDANLRAARAALASARERLPQARAQLLPQVQAAASRFSNDVTRDGQNALSQPLTIYDRYPSSSDTLTLRQPLLRAQQVVGVKQAQAVQREAEAIYAKEEQDASIRVILSYLEVLLAQDTIDAFESQRRFLQSALDAGTKAFEAGFGTRTDIDAAKAKLDFNQAQLLQARQQLDFTRRQLQMFIHRPFGELAPLDGQRLQELKLTELNLDDWLRRAEQTSPEMRRMQAQREAARQELNKARSGHLPTLDLVAQVQRSKSENTIAPQSQFVNNSVGVQLNVPIYNGGYVNSVTRQASADIERIEESLNALRLDVGLRVHREFRGVTEGLQRVQALETAVRSADVALDSARKSVQAGVRTVVDVLNAEQQRTQAWRDLCEARYGTLAALVRLQALAGEAEETLVMRLNGALVR